jgi:hypothetical protein
MSQAVYFVTRYSVVGKAQHTWQIAKNARDYETYRSQVLDAARLTRRLTLFSEITVPSIAAQRVGKVSINWLILVALELPASHMVSLRDAVKPAIDAGVRVEFLVVAPSDEQANLDSHIYAGIGQAIRLTLESDLAGIEAVFATVRLDDDDALAADYSERLATYLRPEFSGMHVSFSRGLQAVYSGGQTFTDVRAVDKPLIALGLALINRHDPKHGFSCTEIHVHGFGNHADLSARTPVIVDGAIVSYLRTLDESSDLGDAHHSRHLAASSEQVAALGLPQFALDLAANESSPPPPMKTGLFRR